MKVTLLFFILLTDTFFSFSLTGKDTVAEAQRTIYLFSGLGADSIPFANLRLPGYHKVYINWIPPLPDESLEHYAGRIKDQITVSHPYFVGLSFGGILAVEVSRQIAVEKMVLISSARTRNDLNQVQNFFMRLGLYRIIPSLFLKHTNFLTNHYFGVRSEKEKKTLTKLLQGTDMSLFRWGLKSIAFWNNRVAPERTIQIHGTADRVMAYGHVHPDYSISGGGHLMILNRADTISTIIMNYFGR